MITAPRSEPGPGGVHPGAVIHTGCADGGGGGQSQHRMGLGHGGPDSRGGLVVSLAEQPVRLGGQFLGAAVVLWSAHRCSTYLVVLALGVIPRTPPGELPFRWHARHGAQAGGREREPQAATNVSAA